MGSEEVQAQTTPQSRPKALQCSSADSAYASVRESNGATSAMEEPPARNDIIRPIPDSDLLMFNCETDKVLMLKFQRIESWLAAELARAIEETGRDVDAFSTHLEHVGRTKEGAAPTILIFCEEDTQHIIHEFMQRPFVKDTFTFRGPNDGLLKYHVVPQPPIELSNDPPVEVLSDTSQNLNSGIRCGAPVVFRIKSGSVHKSSQRTLHGGVLLFHFEGGRTQVLGMSAGHAVRDLQSAEFVEQPQGSRTPDSRTPRQSSPLGNVLRPEDLVVSTAGRVERTFDWILYTLDKPQPNQVVHPRSGAGDTERCTTVTEVAEPKYERGLSEPVLVPSACGSSRRGHLLDISARMWLKDVKKFVDVYILELDGGSLQKGDSGAWVVSETQGFLYGHVVAKNALGQAYIMPALATCENMRQSLGALSYTLQIDPERSSGPVESTTAHVKRNDAQYASLNSSCSEELHMSISSVADGHFNHMTLPSSTLRPNRTWSTRPWNGSSASVRQVYDLTFLEAIKGSPDHRSPLEIFFKPQKNSRPSLALEATQALQQSDPQTNNRTRACLYHETCESSNEAVLQKHLTVSDASQLRAKITEMAVAISGPDVLCHTATSRIGSRCLMSIENMDETFLLVLIETIDCVYVDALRDFISQHLISGFHLQTLSAPIFCMQFHIRYLRLRTVNKHTVSYPPSEGHGHTMSELANPRSLFDCHSGTYQTLTECRQSFLLVGSDNLHWKGYALSGSSRGVSHADMTDSCGEDDGDDDDDDDETVASQEGYMFDKFAQGSSDDLYIQELLSDPREYFLHCLVSRLEIAIGEWSYLISKAEYSIEKQSDCAMSFCGPPRDGTLTRLLGVFLRTTRWIQFLQHCQAKIQAAIRTLVQFLNESDSLSLLQEMTSSKATERLAVIKVNLDELKSLESRLHNMNVALKDLSKMYEFQLALDHRELNRQYNESVDRMLKIFDTASDSSRLSVKLSTEHMKAAKRTSHMSGVIFYLVLVTTPCILVLQYFSAERDLFAFQRTPKTFAVSVIVIMVSLTCITLLLHILGETKDRIFWRIYEWLGGANRRTKDVLDTASTATPQVYNEKDEEFMKKF